MSKFPELPILPAPPNRRSNRERFGSLYFLGIGGLVFVLALISWFGWGVWNLREVWRDTYVLYQTGRSLIDRVQAADRLAHDPRVTTQQKLAILLDPQVPDLARWRVGESLGSDAAESDPIEFSKLLLPDRRQPVWLDLLLLRVLADASDHSVRFPPALLDAIDPGEDRWRQVWLDYARMFQNGAGPEHRERLEQIRRSPGQTVEAAELLARAADAEEPRRASLLREAFLSTRAMHPGVQQIWRGWTETQGRLTPRADP